MLDSDVIKIVHDALMTSMKISAPVLISSLVVGLFVSILQTTTSIQEQTLTFVPKLAAVFLSVIVFFAYMLNTARDYTMDLYSLIVRF